MPTLPNAVLAYLRKHELLKAGDRVAVAVSGGADSVGLLRVLLELRSELGIVLSVAHFNHQLRGAESEEDENFVASLAHTYNLELHRASGDVRAFAAKTHLSLETAARDLRYEFLRNLLNEGCLDRIATAHTLNDQAETVLLRVTRGAGTRGLAGIYPELKVETQRPDRAAIVRPFLEIRRREIEDFLRMHGQPWREDSSNLDRKHRRNYVRHEILPKLEEMNPQVRESLAEIADLARGEEEHWETEITRILPQLLTSLGADDQARLTFDKLSQLSLALRRRVVRAAAESLGCRLEFRQVEEILNLADRACVTLPGGHQVGRNKNVLSFGESRQAESIKDYEYRLPLPGSVVVREAASRFEAMVLPSDAQQGYNPDDFLNRALLQRELCVRNWRAGDRFWPVHSSKPKKVKELLQERHITGPERKLWPVIASGEEVIWMRGFPVSRPHRKRNGEPAVLVREYPLQGFEE